MKVITIGRGDDNQIIIEDNQNLVSRHHATLRISDTGRMEIVSIRGGMVRSSTAL